MALVNKRIIDLPERAELNSDDYTVVDGSNGGTAKYKLSKMQEDITTVDQDVEQLSGTVTQHGQQLTTINQTVTQNTSDITDLKADLDKKTGLSDEAKVALLACFEHVAWINDRGQEYYDALESALYSEGYPRIKATFDSDSHKIYNVFSANDVKQYITVKYYETKESEGTVIPQNSFAVSGTLISGDSVLRVAYQEYSTTVAVTDVIDFYNVHHWNSGTDTDVSAVLDRGTYNTTDPTTQLQTTTVEASYNATRKSMWMKYGENEAYYSDFTLSDYYAIPIPEDATGVSITITPSTYRFNCMFRHINETNPHLLTLVTESGWQTGSYTRNDIPYVEGRGASQMICLNTQGVSGNFSAGDPVFDITFTTE